MDKIEETFKDLQPIFCRKVKLIDMKPMKGERPLDWAMRIDAQEANSSSFPKGRT